MHKQRYEAPVAIELGGFEDLTEGALGGSGTDFLLGLVEDPVPITQGPSA